MANKKNRQCLGCQRLIWDTPIRTSTGLCKKCWSFTRKHSPETIERIKNSAKLRWSKLSEKEKQSKIQRDRFADPKNHPNWKGGITPLSKVERSKAVHRKFRMQILERDKCCVFCGSLKRLEVDHIKPFAFYPELRLDPSNARTLCHDCHKKTPTYARQTL